MSQVYGVHREQINTTARGHRQQGMGGWPVALQAAPAFTRLLVQAQPSFADWQLSRSRRPASSPPSLTCRPAEPRWGRNKTVKAGMRIFQTLISAGDHAQTRAPVASMPSTWLRRVNPPPLPVQEGRRLAAEPPPPVLRDPAQPAAQPAARPPERRRASQRVAPRLEDRAPRARPRRAPPAARLGRRATGTRLAAVAVARTRRQT